MWMTPSPGCFERVVPATVLSAILDFPNNPRLLGGDNMMGHILLLGYSYLSNFGDARPPGRLDLMIIPCGLRRAAEARRRHVDQVTGLEAFTRICDGRAEDERKRSPTSRILPARIAMPLPKSVSLQLFAIQRFLLRGDLGKEVRRLRWSFLWLPPMPI